MADLPPPLIIDILSKLPVKSLFRFRCVSRPWLALINHPRFSKIHVSRSHKQRLLLQKNKSLHSVELETISSLRNSIPVEIELPWLNLDFDDDFWVVIGSCNGLLCIAFLNADIGLLLYNPTTKQRKQIWGLQGGLIGFGYSETIDDYKIVEILNFRSEVRVYSLKTDLWRTIPSEFDFGYSANIKKSTSVNGAIHFVLYYSDQPTLIAAFDLVEDRFRTIPPPDFMLNTVNGVYSVGDLRGSLCLSIENHPAGIELWVMKEYDVTGSWTRILKVNSLHAVDLQPLCYLNDNQVMLAKAQLTKLMVWDSEAEDFEDVTIDGIEDDWCPELVYVESLVPPNRLNDVAADPDQDLLEYWFN